MWCKFDAVCCSELVKQGFYLEQNLYWVASCGGAILVSLDFKFGNFAEEIRLVYCSDINIADIKSQNTKHNPANTTYSEALEECLTFAQSQ